MGRRFRNMFQLAVWLGLSGALKRLKGLSERKKGRMERKGRKQGKRFNNKFANLIYYNRMAFKRVRSRTSGEKEMSNEFKLFECPLFGSNSLGLI